MESCWMAMPATPNGTVVDDGLQNCVMGLGIAIKLVFTLVNSYGLWMFIVIDFQCRIPMASLWLVSISSLFGISSGKETTTVEHHHVSAG